MKSNKFVRHTAFIFRLINSGIDQMPASIPSIALALLATFVLAAFSHSIRAAVDADEQKNSVAYDSVNDRFLVVYNEYEPVDIYGSLVGGDGELYRTDIPISTAPNNQFKPVVSYSPVTETYLVVWLDHRSIRTNNDSGMDIYGQFVSSEGALLGENFLISTRDGDERRPELGYDSVNDRFLVTWTQYPIQPSTLPANPQSRSNVDGRILASDGSFVRRQFKIGFGPKKQMKPAVSFDPITESYLVVWQDEKNTTASGDDIWGQVVSAGGRLLGDPIQISAMPEREWRPAVAYDTQRQRHLVVWMRNNGRLADLYGQFVTAEGALSGPAFVITNDQGGETKPTVGYSEGQDLFLVAYMKNGPGLSSADIHGQFISGDGELLENTIITQAEKVQHRPDIAAMRNMFFVIWTDYRYKIQDDESQYEIVGRIVSPEVLATMRLAN